MKFEDILLFWEVLKPILFIVFIIAASIQILYYLFFYLRVFTLKPKKSIDNIFEPVSVIVAAHNEYDNLKKNLPLILEQNYPEFELILINDRSEDATEQLIAGFQEKYKNLRYTFIKNNGKLRHGKKLAITLGVKASKYENILLTDADCQPSTANWISEMMKGFSSSDIVLGYGPYSQKNTFINKIIRYDTLFIAMQYLSFAKAGIPYMGIGRNLAYKKEIFVKNKGLSSHAHLRSGDDDLFINEVANSNNTAIVIDPESFVYSEPEATFKDWIWQKKRHLTTFNRYKNKHKLLLGTEVFSRELFYILALSLLNNYYNNYIFIILIIIRILLLIISLSYATILFKEPRLKIFIILLDFLLPFLNFCVHLIYPKPKR